MIKTYFRKLATKHQKNRHSQDLFVYLLLTNKQTNKQTDRQTNRQTNKQNKQTNPDCATVLLVLKG